MSRTRNLVLLIGCLGLALVGTSTGCTEAKAETIEVTYYYLPG